MIIAIILAIIVSRKIGFSKKVIWVCFIIGILCELEKIFFFMADTGFGYRLPAEHIPFNLCPFQIFFIFAIAIADDMNKRKFIISYMYPTMLAGGFLGMLLPSIIFLGQHGLSDLATYRYFFFHGMVVFTGLYLYLSKPIEFTIKSFVTALAGLVLIMIVTVWINAFFGWDPTVNFFFLVRPPAENLPIINVKHGWTLYVAKLGGLTVALIGLCYIREIVRDLPKLIKSIGGKLGKGKAE